MPRKFIDHTGQIFDRLTVLSYSHSDKHRNIHWNCRCLCGIEKIIAGFNLRSGITQSCGCLQKEIATAHGFSKHPRYSVWSGMNNRCNNPKEESYKDYGGRGIAVCDRWHRDNPEGLKNFIEDMESTYVLGLTLERRNNDLGYSKENCYWATYKEQNNNTRKNRKKQ